MSYVITEACVDVMDLSCTQVCPVDCIHPGDNEANFGSVRQLFINPRECIDCDACVEVCPVDAIYPEDDVPAESRPSIVENAAFYRR